jgi:methionine synthase II (cobalamin-independent)
MAEQVVKNSGNSNGNGGARQQPPKSPKSQAEDVANEAVDAGRDLKDRIVGLAESSAEAARAKAEEFAETAKEFAADAGETLKQKANAQREAGADYIGSIASAIRRAAREFDDDLPIAGVYMRKAASKVEDISDTVHHGDVGDLVRGVQDFARRQPTVFLGLAVLAGFGAVRFLKSSGAAARVVDVEAQDAETKGASNDRAD